MTRIVRPRGDRKIGGVCSAFANYLGMDPTLMRILWVISAFLLLGTTIVAYFICWLIIPSEPKLF